MTIKEEKQLVAFMEKVLNDMRNNYNELPFGNRAKNLLKL